MPKPIKYHYNSGLLSQFPPPDNWDLLINVLKRNHIHPDYAMSLRQLFNSEGIYVPNGKRDIIYVKHHGLIIFRRSAIK